MITATATAKTRNGNGKAAELKNISQLAFRFDLDRTTVRKRILAAGIVPVKELAKEKLYLLDDRLTTVLERTDEKLSEAKLRRESANARIAELKAMEAEGEMASVAEFTDTVQRLFGAMHKEIAVRLPKQIAGRLAKAKTPSDASAILTRELNKIFTGLREDHSKFLNKPKR